MLSTIGFPLAAHWVTFNLDLFLGTKSKTRLAYRTTFYLGVLIFQLLASPAIKVFYSSEKVAVLRGYFDQK